MSSIKKMRKALSALLSAGIAVSLLPVGYAEDADVKVGPMFEDFLSYESELLANDEVSKLNDNFAVSGDVPALSGDEGCSPAEKKYELLYDDQEGTAINLWGSSDGSKDYIWSASRSYDVRGIVLYAEKHSSRGWDSISFYKIYVVDSTGKKHYVYDMDHRATDSYSVKIEIPEAVGAVTKVGIDPYTTEEITAAGYTRDEQAMRFAEFVIIGKEANTDTTDTTVTIGSGFEDFQAYLSALMSESDTIKLNNAFTVSGDVPSLSGDEGCSPAEKKYELLYDDQAGTAINLWGSSDRSKDYIWSASRSYDVRGIVLYAEKHSSRGWDSISFYKIYVVDSTGKKHYVYDMDHRATDSYSVKIEIPEAVGAVTKVGIDPYTTEEITAAGYTRDEQAMRFAEFVIIGKEANTDTTGTTVTIGSGFEDFMSYETAILSDQNVTKLNDAFTVSGDNTALSGDEGCSPAEKKYELLYDDQASTAINLWGSSDRSKDYIWSAARTYDLSGIVLYAEKHPSRGFDSVSFYRIYVVDSAGQKHYVYDMDHRATDGYAVKIVLPEAMGAITKVGIDPYTTDEIKAAGYTQDEQVLRFSEFVIIGNEKSSEITEPVVTIGSGFDDFKSYEAAIMSDENVKKLNGGFAVNGDNTGVSGSEGCSPAEKKYELLYDDQSGTAVNLWGSPDRTKDYIWVGTSRAFNIKAIMLYAEKHSSRGWDSISFYRIYVVDMEGKRSYIYDMDHRASGDSEKYAVKIELPESIGEIYKVGIEPYATEDIEAAGYTQDEQVLRFSEFVFFGTEASGYIDPPATEPPATEPPATAPPGEDPDQMITVGSSFSDFKRYEASFWDKNKAIKLNNRFTFTGDNVGVSGGTAPEKYELLYDDKSDTAATIWSSSDRSKDFVWTADEAFNVNGIVLYTEFTSYRGRDAISFYKVYVVDEAGEQHYIYDMDHVAPDKNAVRIRVPDGIGPVKKVGIDAYTKAQIAETGNEPNDDALRFNEFVIYGSPVGGFEELGDLQAINPADGSIVTSLDSSADTFMEAKLTNVLNYTDSVKNYALILASYKDDGDLLNIRILEFELQPYESKEIITSTGFCAAAGTKSVKLFVFRDFKTIRPLMKAVKLQSTVIE